MRQLLILLVLINYLTVLLSVNWLLNKPVLSAANPYVHAENCQEHNYLALDCFDKCNGDNSWKQSGKDVPQKETIVLLAAHIQPPVFHFETLPFCINSDLEFPAFKVPYYSGISTSNFPPPKIG